MAPMLEGAPDAGSVRLALIVSRFNEHVTNREWSEVMQVREHHHTLAEDIEGYLPPGECTLVCGKANPAAQILALQTRQLCELRTRHLIDNFRHLTVFDYKRTRRYEGGYFGITEFM